MVGSFQAEASATNGDRASHVASSSSSRAPAGEGPAGSPPTLLTVGVTICAVKFRVRDFFTPRRWLRRRPYVILPRRAGRDPQRGRMCIAFSHEADSEVPEWEPEPLPLGEQLEYRPPRPRHHDETHDSDQSSRVIVIDLV